MIRVLRCGSSNCSQASQLLIRSWYQSARPLVSVCSRSAYSSQSSSQRLQLFKDWRVDPITGIVTHKNKSQGENAPKYQVIVGLEIHAQLDVATKLFSPAEFSFHAPANTCVHPFDAAVPGYLPSLSLHAVQKAVLAAAALHCQIQHTSRFERKHYAYADLPFSYQMTQQRWPLARNGYVAFDMQLDKKSKHTKHISCRVNRIQLEQDTGKTITTTSMVKDGDKYYKTTLSHVDLNRAGVPLLEIVTEPDLTSSVEAAEAVKCVRQLLHHAGACRGKMNQGQLRVDCNVNLKYVDEKNKKKTPRVEIKNLNSIKQVRDAVEYEARRQAHLWYTEPDLLNMEETRTWNISTAETELIRRKDGEEDYRFLPEPDLPPLILNEKTFNGLTLERFVKENLPELPADAEHRLVEQYGLSSYVANVIVKDPPAIKLFDTAMKMHGYSEKSTLAGIKPVAAITANLLSNELFALVKEHVAVDEEEDASVANAPITGEQLSGIVSLLMEGSISSTMAKKLLAILYIEEIGADPKQVAHDRGIELLVDPTQLREICLSVINSHPEELEVYKQGGKFETKLFKLFTGKAMAASKGNAHPERLQEALQKALDDVVGR